MLTRVRPADDERPARAAEGHRCALAALARHEVRHAMVVVAHPDDETIGLGVTLGDLAAAGCRVTVVHVTDGAPRDPALRPKLAGCSRDEAARIRRAEVALALRAGGLDPTRVLGPSFGLVDQEATLSLVALAGALQDRLAAVRPDLVVTHPYEGGHPDHDAVAFAVHSSLALGPKGIAPLLAELTSYHAASGALTTGAFADVGDVPCDARHEGVLDAVQQDRKKRMIAAFCTQQDVLAPFGTAAEPLRCAPRYDFSRPPHDGALYYERLPFGWTGSRWRELAAEASRALVAESSLRA